MKVRLNHYLNNFSSLWISAMITYNVIIVMKSCFDFYNILSVGRL